MTIKTITTTPAKPVTSYAASYAALQAIAERLKGPGTAASIDSLASEVAEARKAFATCSDRLKAIRAEIDVELASTTDGAAGAR